MTISESNITLELPDAAFRFQDCPGFQTLSGNNFKEVDACWFDSTRNVLFLVELKDYTNANLAKTDPHVDKRIWDLVKKAVDSLQMINAIRLKTNYSSNISACAPFVISPDTRLFVLNIIDVNSSQESNLAFLRDEFKRRFSPYAQLFDIKNYSVLSYSKAKGVFDWVV